MDLLSFNFIVNFLREILKVMNIRGIEFIKRVIFWEVRMEILV